MQEYLDRFQAVIQKEIKDPEFKFSLSTDWSSEKPDHRVKIREHLADVDSAYFSKLQWAQLYDLNQRPEPIQGSVSISHCHLIGGYSYSSLGCGFDVEDVRRISDPVIMRTSSEEEISKSPHIKMLWVSKEAAFKALSETPKLLVTDLFCHSWIESEDPLIWLFQIRSKKEVPREYNKGFVMSTPLLLMSVYFK